MAISQSGRIGKTFGKPYQVYHHKGRRGEAGRLVEDSPRDQGTAETQREKVIRTYTDTMPERIPLSQNKEFKSVRNAVIQEAMNILHNRITFEDTLDELGNPAPEIADAETEPKPELLRRPKKNP